MFKKAKRQIYPARKLRLLHIQKLKKKPQTGVEQYTYECNRFLFLMGMYRKLKKTTTAAI